LDPFSCLCVLTDTKPLMLSPPKSAVNFRVCGFFCMLMLFTSLNIEGSVHNLLPVFVFLHHPTDLDKPVMPVFLISLHRKSYKPSKNGAICTSAYLLCAQRFYRSPVFNRTFVQTLIAPCIADRLGKNVLCVNFVANSILHRAQRFYLAQ